jgi:twinkle protein
MTPRDIASLLARDAESVAKLLLPNGRRVGREWKCGSVGGESGDSLGVHLAGDKAGRWCDFATGQSGDLIDLWREAQGMTVPGAIQAAKDYLGVVDKEPRFATPPREYTKPKPVDTNQSEQSEAWTYITQERLISADTIAAFRVGQLRNAIVFPYHDPAGELVMVKFRSLQDKKFRLSESNLRPCLFGWQAVRPEARHVVICEGEFDAMAWREYGMAGLSVPFGGGNGAKQDWIEHELENLERFDDILISMDMDEAGKKAVAEIVDRLGRHRCRVVDLPHKDANDCLLAGVSLQEMQAVLTRAHSMDPSELRNAADYLDDVIAAFNPTEDQMGFATPWDKAKTFRFRPGEVTIIAGVNGHGKSEAAGQFTVDAISQGEKCCVASMEFKPHKWIARLVRQACAVSAPTTPFIETAMKWLAGSLWVFDVATTAKTDLLLEVFAYARRRYGITLFVIDNLSKLNIDLDDYNRQRAFTDELTDFAKQHDVHVILVAHMKKGEDDGKPGGKFDVKGSGAITDLADNVLIWWRNRVKEDKIRKGNLSDADLAEIDNQPDAICRCEKQRNGDDEPRISLWWHAPSHQFVGSHNGRAREYLRWE